MNKIRLDQILFDKGEDRKLYGVFDAALIKGLWVDIDVWNLDFMPLYRGDFEQIVEAIPYVIELDKEKDEDACKLLFENIGKNAILFISSGLELKEVTEKMQYFYHIKTKDGETALRRFYDPRIFPNFITDMNAQNRQLFFENTHSYFSELDKGKKLMSFKKNSDQLVRKTYSLVEISDKQKRASDDEKANTQA